MNPFFQVLSVIYILPTLFCILVCAKHNRLFNQVLVPLHLCFIPFVNIIFFIAAAVDVLSHYVEINKFFKVINDWYEGK